jgi:hypothetical protein
MQSKSLSRPGGRRVAFCISTHHIHDIYFISRSLPCDSHPPKREESRNNNLNSSRDLAGWQRQWRNYTVQPTDPTAARSTDAPTHSFFLDRSYSRLGSMYSSATDQEGVMLTHLGRVSKR